MQCGTLASGERERERVEGKEGDREEREEGMEEKDAAVQDAAALPPSLLAWMDAEGQ